MLHGKVMRNHSTPKEQQQIKKPSLLDFTHLCTESSFEIMYGNFPSKIRAGEPSEGQQQKIRSDEGLTLETSAFRISVRWPIYIINSVDKTKF